MLTHENYFSIEMNRKYMGTSQLKSFIECEAKALAELNEEYIREVTPSMLVGSYVDAHFTNDLDLFKSKNPEIFTRNGGLKSEYKRAEKIIDRIEQDELFYSFIKGENQIIKTGNIEGIPFKIMIDSLHADKIVDLKIMKDFKAQYKDGLYLNFIEFWGYDIQAAIYQAIEGNNLPFIIAGATKEPEPDIALLEITQSRIDYCLDLVKHHLERIMIVKEGLEEPIRCEKCNYCKSTKKLTKVISYDEFFDNN